MSFARLFLEKIITNLNEEEINLFTNVKDYTCIFTALKYVSSKF